MVDTPWPGDVVGVSPSTTSEPRRDEMHRGNAADRSIAADRSSGFPPQAPADTAARLVLLVEDEEPIRRLTARALQRAGWRVSAAESAEAALQNMPHPGDPLGPPCILVSDIMLPGMLGTDLVGAVRAVWPDLPVVLVSGYTDSTLLGDLSAQGVFFLAKPFRLRDLVACVEHAVVQHVE
jgi:two-component system cell cycle sensor histidine kinase/response regulator CckA